VLRRYACSTEDMHAALKICSGGFRGGTLGAEAPPLSKILL